VGPAPVDPTADPTAGQPAPAVPTAGWCAVLLAGGSSRRWGGVDKTRHEVAGVPLLQHAVAAVLPGACALVVVAPADHPSRPAIEAAAAAAERPLVWTREEPPGGGPVAGLAAGLVALPAASERPSPVIGRVAVVLAGDHPFARTAVPRLVQALDADPAAEAATGVDPDGRRQPLLAAYRETALRRRLAGLSPAGQPLRAVLEGLVVIDVPVTAQEALDLDTRQDAERAAGIAGSATG
jgi:molybdopterin-guanine dinucleotide biosynthesis protein A